MEKNFVSIALLLIVKLPQLPRSLPIPFTPDASDGQVPLPPLTMVAEPAHR
jgi:hypothetical protein